MYLNIFNLNKPKSIYIHKTQGIYEYIVNYTILFKYCPTMNTVVVYMTRIPFHYIFQYITFPILIFSFIVSILLWWGEGVSIS